MDEVAELALGATPFDPAVNQRRDTCRIITAMFRSPERIDEESAIAHVPIEIDLASEFSPPPAGHAGGRACALHLAIQRDGRHARCLALHTRPEARMDGRLYHGLPVPPCDPFVAPILYAIPIAQCYVA